MFFQYFHKEQTEVVDMDSSDRQRIWEHYHFVGRQLCKQLVRAVI